MTRKLTMILLGILILCTVGFLYTFLQPRYTATIVSIGRTRTVSSSGKHGRRSHKVVPMVVTFTDHAGVEQTVDATGKRDPHRRPADRDRAKLQRLDPIPIHWASNVLRVGWWRSRLVPVFRAAG